MISWHLVQIFILICPWPVDVLRPNNQMSLTNYNLSTYKYYEYLYRMPQYINSISIIIGSIMIGTYKNPRLFRTVLGHFPGLSNAKRWAKWACSRVSFNYFEYTISANNKMPKFPGLSRMDLVFPGLSSTGKIIKKNPGLSRIFKDATYGPCNHVTMWYPFSEH